MKSLFILALAALCGGCAFLRSITAEPSQRGYIDSFGALNIYQTQ